MSTKINIARYNAIQTDVDDILGTGANGYGQADGKSAQITIPTGINRTIQATEVNNLVADLRRILIHQDGIDYSSTIPTVGQTTKITEDYFANVLEYYRDKAKTNRWKMSSIASQSTTATGISSTRNTGWNDVIVHEVSANYSSESNARYFFNAGGEIILTTSLSGNNTTKSNAWATILNGVGSIVMNHEKTESTNQVGTGSSIGYYSLTSTYQQVYSCACSAPYTANVYSVWAKKDGQFVSVKAVFTDAYVDTPDSLVTGTISSTVKYRIASATGTASAPGVSLLSNAPSLSNITNLSDSGVSQSNMVVLSPNPASEGSDLTAVISTYPALSSVWYKLVGTGVGNRFAVTTAQKTLSGGILTFTLPIAMDPTTSGSGPVSMELWDKDPASQGAIKLTTSAAITVTDTPITITLAISTPSNAVLNETSARTGNFLITSNLPENSTLAIAATGTGASLLTVPATAVTNSSGSATFAITVNPDHKTTGDLIAGIKVSLGSVDSNIVQVTIQDTSKPVISYSSPKDNTGATAYTHQDLTYTISGGKPNGTFTVWTKAGNSSFTQDGGIRTMNNAGNFPALFGGDNTITGLTSPDDLTVEMRFIETNDTQSHITHYSSQTQDIELTSPRDIPAAGNTIQIDFKLTFCYAPTVVNWELVGTNTIGIVQDVTNLQSGTFTTSGNNTDGIGALVLRANSSSVKGTSFTVKFTVGSLNKSTDPIRVIDIFPFTAFTDSQIFLPTLSSAVTIAVRGGAGGGGAADGGGKGGSGAVAYTILTKEPVSSTTITAKVGKGGGAGVNSTTTGGGAGGAGYKKGGNGGNVRTTGRSGGGGGAGGASAVLDGTTELVVAGGGAGGGGGSLNRYGLSATTVFSTTTTFNGTDGVDGAGGGSGDGGGAGGSGGFVVTVGANTAGSDDGSHATAGTSGIIGYNNTQPSITGTPIIYNTNKSLIGGKGATVESSTAIAGGSGIDGEITVYVAPLHVQYPTVKLRVTGTECDITATQPLKDGAGSVTDYTVTANNGNTTHITLPMTWPVTISNFTPSSSVLFSITANNAFGSGLATNIATETANVTDNTKPSSKFGTSVAMSGDGTRMVVGSPIADNKGLVYIYLKSGNLWTLEQTITASNSATGDQFGFSVAITDSGDRIVVGATGNNSNRGSWYVYHRNGSTWLQEWYGTIGSSGDALGSSVSINSDGTKVVIGSEKDDNAATNSGRIRIFTRVVPANTWSFSYGANGSESNAYFGWSTAMAGNGNRVITGQYAENNNSKVDNGSVAIHKFTTAWSLESMIYAPEVTEMMSGENFGWAVTINYDGTKAAISAPKRTVDGVVEAGIVFTYTKSATGNIWDHEDTIRSPTVSANAHFGYSLSLNDAGNVLLIGENSGNPTNITGAGVVYLYKKTGNSWILDKTITAADRDVNNSFGTSVSLSSAGDLAVIGAPNTTYGTAYTFQV